MNYLHNAKLQGAAIQVWEGTGNFIPNFISQADHQK